MGSMSVVRGHTSTTTKQELVISFDNSRILSKGRKEGRFITRHGPRSERRFPEILRECLSPIMNWPGFAMWEAGGDYKDLLIDAIRAASGVE
ncbi:hypothetical protein D9757_014733 [Collybiopsis confluens]|uniref:Uncharacterized protein n=1 Tax=Collybiopsis confluens TaxID=2823264 RepID=A0A8H5LTQ3_9AGAR|nr:hypothetical protein D9757_014733 [Collybiopsis confluens]